MINAAKWSLIGVCLLNSSLEWTAIEVVGVNVINIYQTPPSKLCKNDSFAPPSIYAGDFKNCHSTAWVYQATSPDGATLEDWASAADVLLPYDPKQPDSFRSGRWNTTSNPDLAFSNLAGPSPQCNVLEPLPKSQHRPSLIAPNNPMVPKPTKPAKRRNFRKARREQFTELVESKVSTLPTPQTSNVEAAYTALCHLLIKSAKQTIPRGCRQQYIRTWDNECNQHYKEVILLMPRLLT